MIQVRSSITRVQAEAEDEWCCARCHEPLVGACLRYESPGPTVEDYPDVWLFHYDCEP